MSQRRGFAAYLASCITLSFPDNTRHGVGLRAVRRKRGKHRFKGPYPFLGIPFVGPGGTEEDPQIKVDKAKRLSALPVLKPESTVVVMTGQVPISEKVCVGFNRRQIDGAKSEGREAFVREAGPSSDRDFVWVSFPHPLFFVARVDRVRAEVGCPRAGHPRPRFQTVTQGPTQIGSAGRRRNGLVSDTRTLSGTQEDDPSYFIQLSDLFTLQ